MPSTHQTKPDASIDTAYLITTRRCESSFYTGQSSRIELFTNDLFWKFVVGKSGLLDRVDSMLNEDKMLLPLERLLSVIDETTTKSHINHYIKMVKEIHSENQDYDLICDIDDYLDKKEIPQDIDFTYKRILKLARDLQIKCIDLLGILTASTITRLSHDDFSNTLSRIKKATYSSEEADRRHFAEIVLALGIIKNYQRDVDVDAVTKLFFHLHHFEKGNVYVTHHWYNRKLLDLELKGDKLAFLDTLIAIVQSDCQDTVFPPVVKLFAHSKDIFERGIKDAIVSKHMLLSSFIELNRESALAQIIAQRHCYAFQHDDKSMFYHHVLRLTRSKNVSEILDGFLGLATKFAPARILELRDSSGGSSSKKCIHIHMDFSQGQGYQFPVLFNDIVDFNLHAWKADKKFIPLMFHELIEEDDTKKRAESGTIPGEDRSSSRGSKKVKVEELTRLPILFTSDRELCGESDHALIKCNPKARYLDSSIWMRFKTLPKGVSCVEELPPDDVNGLFPSDFFVYRTANAREIREFNARLCLNSMLQDFVSGHGKHVTPYPFCSEEENRKESESQWRKLNEKIGSKKCTFRILLIDDKSRVCNRVKNQSISKIDVLKDVLQKHFYVTEEIGIEEGKKQDKPIIVLDSVHTLEEAKYEMNLRKYDVLLLDYLLEYNNQSEKLHKASYGTELLVDIVKTYDKKRNSVKYSGTLKRFWIFFVSTFSSAIREDMRVKNMHYSEPYWHIARGACPIITPELFRSNFLYLLNQQIGELTDIGGEMNSLNTNHWVVTFIDFMKVIFQDRAGAVRQSVIYSFNSFLRLRAHYNDLHKNFFFDTDDDLKFEPNSHMAPSLMVKSLFPDIECYGNSFWRHMQHLLYLIAFGNVSQWEIMWDEYICVKNALHHAETLMGDTAHICESLEEYIIQLKDLNSN